MVALHATHFMKRDIYDLDDSWQAYMSSAPELHAVWLSRFPCPNLTRLDLDYPRLCDAWVPIAINSNMASLQHLRISGVNVHLCISAHLRLQTLFVAAAMTLTLDILDIPALAANLTTVQLSWVSCCPTTLKFAALFKAQGMSCEEKWSEDTDPEDQTTTVGFPKLLLPEDVNLVDRCACGVCYTCCTRSMHLSRRDASYWCRNHFVKCISGRTRHWHSLVKASRRVELIHVSVW